MKIYINGRYYSKEEAAVSVFDHGLLYGDGVFEGIRAYAGKVFMLREHIDRLFQSARAILLPLPMDPGALEEAVLDAVRVNSAGDCYIRLVVTRGVGPLGLDPSSCHTPTVIIIMAGLTLYPQEHYLNGIEVVTASTRRMPPDVLESRIKSLNYLNNVMAKIEARQAGCLEAVMLNKEGYVAECTADNVFVIRKGELLSPPPSQGALDGITMNFILELASGIGVRAGFAPLTRFDLFNAEECFLTGTGAEIVPVIKVDGRTVGDGRPGPITLRLMAEFKKTVYGQAAQ